MKKYIKLRWSAGPHDAFYFPKCDDATCGLRKRQMNTSRWFKYFTGWDAYNTWDSSQYRQNNSEQGKWRNHICSTIFLNPEVGDRFVEDFIGTMPSGEKYQQFADYLAEKYIDSNALFPPKLWAPRSWQKMPASLFTQTKNIKIWIYVILQGG